MESKYFYLLQNNFCSHSVRLSVQNMIIYDRCVRHDVLHVIIFCAMATENILQRLKRISAMNDAFFLFLHIIH